MTKNRKAKYAARTLAGHAEINYTEARRREAPTHDATGTSRAAVLRGIASLQAMDAVDHEPDGVWGADEPTFGQRVRTDLDWADVVLDGRRGHDSVSDRVPEVFGYDTRPVDARGQFQTEAGVLVEGYALGGDVHRASPEVDVASRLWGKPGVVVRVTYPDGLRIGYLSWHHGDYNASAQGVWQSYADRPLDGFGWALSQGQQIRRVHSYDEVLDRIDHARTVTVGAVRLRAVMEHPERWFAQAPPAAPVPGGNAIGDLWWLATSGFITYPDAVPFLEGWQDWDFVPAQDGGFDLADAEDREWLVAAGSGEWHRDHDADWGAIARLREQGWTIGALSLMHEQLRHRQEAHYNRSRAQAAAAGVRHDFEAAFASSPRWTESDADQWVRVAGSPAAASALIENGEVLPD